jgi:flagellar protein FliS
MMPRNSRSYLETQVLTSPPQKLQLILIEAAIRFAKKAVVLREQGDENAACELIGRAQKIVSEIIGSLNQETDPELVGQIAAIYVFIARSLSQANLPENSNQLVDAIRILEEERTTWRMVCEKMALEGSGQNEAAVLHQQTQEPKTRYDDVDLVAMHATAGNATLPEENPLSMPSATYGPSHFFNSRGSHQSISGISGASKLAGPNKPPSESTVEPTAGFSIDA